MHRHQIPKLKREIFDFGKKLSARKIFSRLWKHSGDSNIYHVITGNIPIPDLVEDNLNTTQVWKSVMACLVFA
jgi:hypothetical protein